MVTVRTDKGSDIFNWSDTLLGQYGRSVHDASCSTIPVVVFRVNDCVVCMLDLSLRRSAS
jgi:hypothetical protein